MPGKMDAVGFLIRSMVERDPSKRRVKPSQQALEDFDGLTLEDSSDDSDYKQDDQGDNEDDADSAASDEEDSEDEGGSSDGSLENGDDVENTEATVTDLLKKAGSHQEAISGITASKICAVCLGSRSAEQNEIIECDECHITVHEDCCGISDSTSLCSGSSTVSVVPWFCDACRAGLTSLQCDLCPNVGGLLKETDTGRWVHLLCALYVPGVAFGNVESLSSATLFEVSYSRWGAKTCSLCEDPLFSRTGITIQCDAGMCKASFHTTCAQRHGLLEEVRHEEQGADPYFAHCKAHSDKTAVRSRKKNYMAMRLYQRGNHPQKMDGVRLQRKLRRAQDKVHALRVGRESVWTPTMKLVRPIGSSAYLCRMLLRRAELNGPEAQAAALSETPTLSDTTEARSKWHVPAAFSAEFVNYFVDRSGRFVTLKNQLQQLMVEKTLLGDRSKRLTDNQVDIEERLSGSRQMGDLLRTETGRFYESLNKLAAGKLKLPEVLLSSHQRRQSVTNGRRSHVDAALRTPQRCVGCQGSGDQHQIAVCDTCGDGYHLRCLNPPLSRMPRKSKTAGWQCSRCGERSRSGSVEDSAKPMMHLKRSRLPRLLFEQGATYDEPRHKRHGLKVTARRGRRSLLSGRNSARAVNGTRGRGRGGRRGGTTSSFVSSPHPPVGEGVTMASSLDIPPDINSVVMVRKLEDTALAGNNGGLPYLESAVDGVWNDDLKDEKVLASPIVEPPNLLPTRRLSVPKRRWSPPPSESPKQRRSLRGRGRGAAGVKRARALSCSTTPLNLTASDDTVDLLSPPTGRPRGLSPPPAPVLRPPTARRFTREQAVALQAHLARRRFLRQQQEGEPSDLPSTSQQSAPGETGDGEPEAKRSRRAGPRRGRRGRRVLTSGVERGTVGPVRSARGRGRGRSRVVRGRGGLSRSEQTLYREQLAVLRQARQRLKRRELDQLTASSQDEDESEESPTRRRVEMVSSMKIKISMEPGECSTTSGESANRTPPAEDKDLSCSKCTQTAADDSPVISCDQCRRGFHLSCLQPPLTKNPKGRRGYSWYCGACSAATLPLLQTPHQLPRTRRSDVVSNSAATTPTLAATRTLAATPSLAATPTLATTPTLAATPTLATTPTLAATPTLATDGCPVLNESVSSVTLSSSAEVDDVVDLPTAEPAIGY